MYTEINSALASAKIALSIAKAAKNLSNYNELVTAVSEVNAKLVEATVVALASLEKQNALTDEINSLKEELMKREDWESQSKDYVLQSVGAQKSHFAQVYKPPVESSKAKHWACAKCFQEHKIYILTAIDRFHYKCPNCQEKISPIKQGGGLAPIDSAYE